MTLEAAAQEPCWELEYEIERSDERGHPHHATLLDARTARVEEMLRIREAYPVGDEDRTFELDLVLHHSRPSQLARSCVHLVCDGCDLALDHEGEMTDAGQTGLHIDPDDVDRQVSEHGWTASSDGRHACGDCTPLGPVDPAVEARIPGPNDIPMFTLLREGAPCPTTP